MALVNDEMVRATLRHSRDSLLTKICFAPLSLTPWLTFGFGYFESFFRHVSTVISLGFFWHLINILFIFLSAQQLAGVFRSHKHEQHSRSIIMRKLTDKEVEKHERKSDTPDATQEVASQVQLRRDAPHYCYRRQPWLLPVISLHQHWSVLRGLLH